MLPDHIDSLIVNVHRFVGCPLALIVLDRRDWIRATRAVLYRRHVRYVLASYFSVRTVVSLVHLKDELSSDARMVRSVVSSNSRNVRSSCSCP